MKWNSTLQLPNYIILFIPVIYVSRLKFMITVVIILCNALRSTTFIPPQSHDVAGWPVLIGISETLIRSKCTGIILFVYYVPVLSCPWLAYYKWPKASGESGGTWKHIEAHKDDLLDSICRAVPQTPFFFCPPRDAMLHCTFPPSLHLPGLSIIPSLCV